MSANKARGFTLIEVLVAIAIFASLSIAAYQVLYQVQLSNQVSAQREARLSELQRAMVMMDADFRQMAARAFRTNGEAPTRLLVQWRDYLLDSDEKGVLFTRLGWHNPQQQFPRGEVLKVGYRLKDHVLERVWWRYPDTPVAQEPVIAPVLSEVESWSMRFYQRGEWSEQWESERRLPEAVSVRLILKDYGEIERVYLLTGASLGEADGAS
ncbi:type II secretion system minor pseudopilin GspJ [Vibrio metschnikovii]|uniref:type II secretion system minor pseudopilin GspJ n=1 Tax=Vibrio metschnikovii TaxID=28172 RepID=UPI0029E1FA12|nr:type II secretion system minor pseudopilin GspJ [Vibrio metschnikovii]EKO3568221.1 type II secretion system minor pseudopilin GspJ [Vibrio metschnikovii]EKO3603479.1 type II secretion system minor pseudopilin GspJ [Vibrio metschnikovii]EKO3656543.1 type II secretion system minor pseudopilin GspJ [Vibrio metschnikovii]EKO3762531.1 type II secretion system minor pseudopilin GspJ [Vibrio metschnikovii]